jgi:hypothetical protein
MTRPLRPPRPPRPLHPLRPASHKTYGTPAPPMVPRPEFKCSCGATLRDFRRLKEHVDSTQDPWWRCSLSTCGAVFDTMTSYEAHIMARESDNDGHVSTLKPIVSQLNDLVVGG